MAVGAEHRNSAGNDTVRRVGVGAGIPLVTVDVRQASRTARDFAGCPSRAAYGHGSQRGERIVTNRLLQVFVYELKRNIRRKAFLFTTFGVPVIGLILLLV